MQLCLPLFDRPRERILPLLWLLPCAVLMSLHSCHYKTPHCSSGVVQALFSFFLATYPFFCVVKVEPV